MSLENIISEMSQYRALTWNVNKSFYTVEEMFRPVNEFINQTGFHMKRNNKTGDFEISPFLRIMDLEDSDTCEDDDEYEYSNVRIKLSADKTKLSIIDDNGFLKVVDLKDSDVCEDDSEYEYPDGRIRLSSDNTKLLIINDYGPWLLIEDRKDYYKFTVNLNGTHIGYCEDPVVMIGRVLGRGFVPHEESKLLDITEENEEQMFPILVEFPQHVFIDYFNREFYLK